MKEKRLTLTQTAIAVRWLAVVAPVLMGAAPVDTSQWRCEFCPFEDGEVSAEAEAGSIYVDDSAAKFGEYDGLSEDGSYLALGGSARQRRGNGLFWSAVAQDLGLDSRSAAVSGGREGEWQVDLGYVASPHNVFDTTLTPFSVGAEQSLTLPPAWVRAGNTQNMTALDSSLRRYDLEASRERWSLDGRVDLGSHWSTELNYTHETRDGQRLLGSSFITTSSQLPAPVDFVTDQLDWSARYATDQGVIGLSYFGSFFSNRRADFVWSNPFTAIAPGADLGRTALAPDNNFHQLAVNFSRRLGEVWYLRMNGSLGRGKQDDAFLPYTTNALIPMTPLPRTSLDGEVDMTHVDLQLSGNLGKLLPLLQGLRGKLSYRYDERDNTTAQGDYSYVEGDTFPAGVATNVPYGYRRQDIALFGEYDLGRLLALGPGRSAKLSGGWDREEWDRSSFQEIDNSTEDSAWVRVQVRPASWLTFDARYGGANRETDPYVAPVSTAAPQNPLLRKFNLANRERDFWDFGADLSLAQNITLSLDGFHREDDYIDSVIGLTNSEDVGGTADLSWTVTEKIAAFAFYAHQEITSKQSGSQSFGAPDWRAESRDRIESASLGLRLRELAERWNVQFDYFLMDSRGEIEMLTGIAAATFPPLNIRSHGPRLNVVYRATPALEIIGNLQYEHFDADDWALDGVEPDTLASILSSGADAYDYDVNLVGLSFRYSFGRASEEDAEEPAESP
jgi:MtrB/PioB family decaheme-associated outer membrane protein